MHDPALTKVQCYGFDQAKLGNDFLPNTINLKQASFGGAQHTGQITKAVKQVACQRFDVAAWQRAKQNKFQKLIIMQRHIAAPTQA